MEMYLIGGSLTAVGFYILCWKVNMDLACQIDAILDVALTALLLWMFSGTMGGMYTAVIAGVLFSLMMWVTKKLRRKPAPKEKPTLLRN